MACALRRIIAINGQVSFGLQSQNRFEGWSLWEWYGGRGTALVVGAK